MLAVACGDAAPPAIERPAAGKDASTVERPRSAGETRRRRRATRGPDLGVCACAELDFSSDVPNLYLVLDRSGSMAADEQMDDGAPHRLAGDDEPRAARELRRSRCFRSRAPTRATRASRACSDERAPRRRAGGNARTDDEGRCSRDPSGAPSGGTPTAATLHAFASDADVARRGARSSSSRPTAGRTATRPPRAARTLCIDEHREATRAVRPAARPTAASTRASTARSTASTRSPRSTRVTAIATAGIPVYVIGVPGSGPYAALLDQLATGGGTAPPPSRSTTPSTRATRPRSPRPSRRSPRRSPATCTLTLAEAPPEPDPRERVLRRKGRPADGPRTAGR